MVDQCLADPKVRHYFTDSRISWHFNPPSAPHMGGYWEAAIKRIKYHIKRALGNVLLSYEEFNTLLTEVEACVNLRPLVDHSSQPGDGHPLTPGHFIIGEPLKTLPELPISEFLGSLNQRWQLVSSIRTHIWRRWRTEYITTLQKRAKWFRTTPNLEKDDIVVIHDNLAPPAKWKIGSIVDLHAGDDGQVRVVRLHTNEGRYFAL